MKTYLLAALIAAAISGPAFAQGEETHDGMIGMMTMRAGTEMSEADRGYMNAMKTMQHQMMQMEMTGDPSGDFARMMIPHHQSAIDMADVLLAEKSIDPELKKMAEKMKADQKREIEELRKWLEAHKQ